MGGYDTLTIEPEKDSTTMKRSTSKPRIVGKAQAIQDVLPSVSQPEHALPLLQSTELKPRACMTERDEALKVRGFWAGIGPGCVVSNSASA